MPRAASTYGHCLIVAPWGEILAEAGEEPGFILAEIDPAKVAEARRAVPSLGHDRPFAPPAEAPGSGRIGRRPFALALDPRDC